jgi:hypothetical protein
VAGTSEKTILWACVSLYEKFQIDGKTDLLCNQDLQVISTKLKDYPDKPVIQELRRKAQADIRSEAFSKKDWQGLVQIFREHFGRNPYPDLPGETPPRNLSPALVPGIPGSYSPTASTGLDEIRPLQRRLLLPTPVRPVFRGFIGVSVKEDEGTPTRGSGTRVLPPEVPPIETTGRTSNTPEKKEGKMANNVAKLLGKLSFDGTRSANVYLASFEDLSRRQESQDPTFDGFMKLETMKQQLKNANPPPEKGVDGEAYEGPATWLTRQPFNDICTYSKLVMAIKKRYHGETETDMGKVLDAIATIRPDWKKDSMKDYFGRIRDVNGASFQAAVIRLIIGVLPSEVRQQLIHPSVNWKEMSLTEYENFCIRVWETVRHPDPSFAMRPAE